MSIPSTICVLNLLNILMWVLSLHSTVLATSNLKDSRCPSPSFHPNITTSPEEAHLKVLVPNLTTLLQFVDCSDPARVRGFCIDVFERALSLVEPNMSIHYTCFNFSSNPNSTGPTYNDMVELVANGTYDVVVGDVTIGAYRLSRVDFTHPYMESGLVVLTKVVPHQFSPWLLFALPFALSLWGTIAGAFAFAGILICFLEHTDHPEFSDGYIVHRIYKILW